MRILEEWTFDGLIEVERDNAVEVGFKAFPMLIYSALYAFESGSLIEWPSPSPPNLHKDNIRRYLAPW